MEIGRRYIYLDTDNKTYTGDVVSISDKMVTIQNMSCESCKNSWGLFHTERNLIKWTFPLADLIEGNQYVFTFNMNDKTIEGTFINILGRHDTVRLKTSDAGIYSFSLYSVTSINLV